MPNVITVDEQDDFVFDNWLETKPKKSPEPISFINDPVALACASYRLWQEGGSRWKDLDTIKLEQVDYDTADALKKYYAGKMTFDALKGEGLRTPFRKKLYAIAANCHEYTKEDIGLLYRLPYFYKEDLTLDRLVSEFKTSETFGQPREVIGVFSLHTRLLRSRRSMETYQYWLRCQGRDELYKVVARSDDPLRSLLESLLEQPRAYTALAYCKGMQGNRRFSYLQLGNLKVV